MFRRLLPVAACAAGFLLGAGLLAGAPAGDLPADEAALRGLNAEYIRAFLASDVNRLRLLVAEDFHAVLASGQLIAKPAFLAEAAQKPDAADFRLHDVSIHIYGDAAVLSAEATYKRSSGAAVDTRYTDVYVRKDGRWLMVSAQWTRVAR